MNLILKCEYLKDTICIDHLYYAIFIFPVHCACSYRAIPS